MAFAVGETVAYPGYGAAVIEDLETRQMKGEDKTYLVLRIVAQSNLVVRVPACNLDLVGVRDCVDRAGLERVIAVLREPDVEELAIWSRRFKANSDKVRSGDVIAVAEVVRDLWRRERDGTVSAAERQMLAKARQILVSEIAFCEQTDDATAQARLDELLDC
jgi:CarD family transcriptional regulator